MLKTAVGGVGAGLLIAIGGCVYLACENAYVGAMLFSVALLCICWQGFDLFTGKIGYITENRNARFASALAVTLLANIVCVFLLGTAVRYALPALSEKAASICAAKLAQTYLQTFVRAAFCGVLMYLAVDIFRKKKTPLGVVFCIPVFILSGFEHSVADAFYFGVSGAFETKTAAFLVFAVLGNAIGSIITAIISIVKSGPAKEQ